MYSVSDVSDVYPRGGDINEAITDYFTAKNRIAQLRQELRAENRKLRYAEEALERDSSYIGEFLQWTPTDR